MPDAKGAATRGMPPIARGARRAGTARRLAGRRSTIAFCLCRPLILLVAGFVIYPAFYAIWLSMLNKKMTAFVGLDNFAFLLKRNLSGRSQRIWRGLLLVPWVIPLPLSTLTWWWMFDPSYSAFNWLLNQSA